MNSILPILPNFLENDSEKEIIDDPKAELDDQKLWKEFSEFGTEMVITKSGRRMFPTVRVKLSGLDPTSRYMVLIEMIPTDQFRYKFSNGAWKVSGKCDFEPIRAPLVHPNSKQSGEQWMKMGANFKMLKLSNDHLNPHRHIFLNSMHRYHPRLHIVRCDRFDKAIVSTFKSFIFKYTDFMAVTAYQNEEVTRKKIENNPFAKGFRNQTNKKTMEKRSHDEMVKETPPPSEDEEPQAKKLKVEENSDENPPHPDVPKISMEFLAQWQMAIISAFGSLPTLESLKQTDVPVKKIGFDVSDLLGSSS